jgi:uncharacterized protein (TIGR03435 family)
MRIKHLCFGIAFSAATLSAQNPARPVFEVASIRPSAEVPQGGAGGLRIDGAQVRTSYMSLRDYIGMAYRLKPYQISGPDWLAKEHFDISATLPEGTLPSDLPAMMQSLLEDRFQMKVHREKKDFPVYALEVAKGGLKITEDPPDPDLQNVDARAPQSFVGVGSNQGISFSLGKGASLNFSNNKLEGKRLNMETLAAILERFLDRPVVDTTELKGNYSMSVDVTSEDYRAMMIRGGVNAGVSLPPDVLRLLEGMSAPGSLFDGLAKLGLKLDGQKAPLDLLVVDSVLRKPTEN